MNPKNVKNIIFDLGDVILNIDIPKTLRAFAELSGLTDEKLQQLFVDNELFRKFETGNLTDEGFRDLVREILQLPNLTDEEIDRAWNTLLLDIPTARISLLKSLAERYNLYLLSNTSSIHIQEVNRILRSTSDVTDLNQLFDKVFFSYELGLMKPDTEIYTRVLESAGINADETLFLDDNLANVEGAKKVGIHAIHVQKPLTILEYLAPYA